VISDVLGNLFIVAFSLQYEMGVLAFQMGERERGEECFRQFIRIRKAKGSEMDEGVANALFVLGR